MAVGAWIRELSRRRVIRVALFYAAGAWLCVEMLVTLMPVFDADAATTRIAVVLVLLGFPVAVVLAWYFDVTPEGIERTSARAGAAKTAAPRVDLPAQRTVFIGRTEELDRIGSLLREGRRVITLTGPGGIGKTRLAIAAAAQAADVFDGGITYVSLASVTSTQLVIPAIAQALHVREVEGRTLDHGVRAFIGGKRYLLVLDNFEQVIEAATHAGALTEACCSVTLLVTSRAPLRLTGEHEVSVPPLTREDAVDLFIDRARAVRPELVINEDIRRLVAEICEKLDALPLALELAAARVRVLEPDQLLPRLQKSLDLLSSGARDAPDRQRTLRATIDWSYSLLSADERQLLRRLSVFSGGFSQEAVEAICCNGDASAALDRVGTLVENSLVRRGNRMPFTLLEAIREYSAEKLAEAGETDFYAREHANYYVSLAHQADAAIRDHRQLEWVKKVVAEGSNLRAALDHLVTRARAGDESAAEQALLLCGSLWFHWHIQGAHSAVVERVIALLELPAARARSLGRLRALRCAGVSVWSMGDYDRAHALIAESVDIARGLGADTDVAASLFPLGMATLSRGDVAAAKMTLEEGVTVARALGDRWALAWNACFLAIVNSVIGAVTEAEELFRESALLCRDIGDFEGLGWSLAGLADIARARGRYDNARLLYAEAGTAYDRLNDRVNVARMLEGAGATALGTGNAQEARAAFGEAVEVYRAIGSRRGMGLATLGLAAAAAVSREYDQALRIEGEAAAMRNAEGISYTTEVPVEILQLLERARAAS